MNERSENEIRESIEATRARMGDTIEEIGERVNPDRVRSELKAKAREQIDEAKNNMKRKARNTMRDVEHGVSDTGRGIWATIRDNPVPAGMIGVGLAWLVANRRGGDEQRHREYGTYSTGPAVPYRTGYVGSRYDQAAGYGETGRIEYGYEGTGARSTADYSSTTGSAQFRSDGTGQEEGIREKASNVMREATDRLSDAQERVGSWAHDAQDRVGDVAHQARDRVGSVAERARYRAHDVERRVEDSFQENPLATGAVAMAIGMAAGLMIPETQREHELMGRGRDRVFDRAQEAARNASENIHEAAREAASESARNAVDGMWPGADDNREGFSEPRR